MAIPVILSILLATKGSATRNKIKKIILIFFITECFLAIYERSYIVNIFPYEINNEYISIEQLGFRSTAFLGHPLQNALGVSIIMGFILVSDMKLIWRMSFILLGYIALLCFNARGAILVWSILMVIYIVQIGLSKNRKVLISFKTISFFIFAGYIIFILIAKQNFGNRFFQGLIIDGSALTRVDVFRAFGFINSNDFWLGNSNNYIPVMNKLGAGGVENSYIVAIINYGIVMAIALFILFFLWMKQLLTLYTSFAKFIIFVSFILVGSMNNSLASSSSWMFFILSVHSFISISKPQSITNIEQYMFQRRNEFVR